MKFNGTPGLVLPGGGARAAYQVGVLKALVDVSGSESLPFRCVAGISAGAINGMSLARHADDFAAGVSHLEQTWGEMQSDDVFLMDYGALQAFLAKENKPNSLLNNAPLRELLAGRMESGAEIRQQVENGHLDGFAITASSFTNGDAVTFFEANPDLIGWHTRRRHSVATQLGVEHLMASSALPILFPPQEIDGEYFVDGSLRMTQPLSPAIKMGADRILVIGVRNESLPLDDESTHPPGIAEVAGYTLDSLFSENLNADIERMEEVNGLLRRVPFWRKKRLYRRPVRVFVIRPSEDLRTIAARHAIKLPRGIRLFLRTVGGWGHEWRMPSYLLFEAAFARDLIELGYRDGLKLRPMLESFFA